MSTKCKFYRDKQADLSWLFVITCTAKYKSDILTFFVGRGGANFYIEIYLKLCFKSCSQKQLGMTS